VCVCGPWMLIRRATIKESVSVHAHAHAHAHADAHTNFYFDNHKAAACHDSTTNTDYDTLSMTDLTVCQVSKQRCFFSNGNFPKFSTRMGAFKILFFVFGH
jgi:hypothetical protein